MLSTDLAVTATEPIIGRKYTLTHSDITADLFLTIGLEYAYDEISEMRDEVLAEWQTYEGNPLLYVYVLCWSVWSCNHRCT